MPDRFQKILEHDDGKQERSRFWGRVFYAVISLVAAAALYLAVFGHSTDTKARSGVNAVEQAAYQSCLQLNAARAKNNREIKVPLRNFGMKQAQATAALVAFLKANANPDATPAQRAAFDTFIDLFRKQADAARELNHITIPKPTPCTKP